MEDDPLDEEVLKTDISSPKNKGGLARLMTMDKEKIDVLKPMETEFSTKKKFIKAKEAPHFIFQPNDGFKSKWDLLIMLSAIFNCFTIPFKVGFQPPIMESEQFQYTNNIIDFIFFLDMCVTFRTSFIDDLGNEVNEPKDIAI